MIDRLKSGLWAIVAISLNTFREAVRNKVFGSLLVFAVILIGMTFVLGQMSLHEEERVATDFSLGFSALFSVVIAVYSSVTLLHTEIERRTIYTIVSKPIYRWQFLLGKYFGVLILLGAIVALLCAVSSGVVAIQGGDVTATFLWAFVTLFLQLSIITSMALFFASFASPLLSGLCTGAIFVVGNLISQLEALKKLLTEMGNPIAPLMDVLRYILPNLEALNLSTQATYGTPISAEYMLSAVWYAVSYSAVTLLFAMLIFSRRDFN